MPSEENVKIIWRCRECHSSDVRADALLTFDVDSQRWEIENVFSEQGSFCARCDGTTRLEKVPYADHQEPEDEDEHGSGIDLAPLTNALVNLKKEITDA